MMSKQRQKEIKINKMTKTKFNRKGLQRLVRQKKVYGVVINYFDFYYESLHRDLNKKYKSKEKQEEIEDIKGWLNEEGRQENPNWIDCYWKGNWCRNRKEVRKLAIAEIKSLPSNVEEIYICDQNGKKNNLIVIDLIKEKGFELQLWF